MRNKQSFVNKLGQIDGKIKAIKVLVTRPQTLQEINRSLDTIDNLLEDLSDMLESEN
jgi:DNA-binding FrmR family transcriptional regulator